MGIKGLLQILKSSQDNNVHLHELTGQRCAIDMSIWLHRALFCCPVDDNQRTNKYLILINKLLNLFLKAGITVTAVFDGKKQFPLKCKVHTRRQQMKKIHAEKAEQSLITLITLRSGFTNCIII
jgi:5'-3' exonuclease